MKNVHLILLVCVSLIGAAVTATAKDKHGKGDGRHADEVSSTKGDAAVQVKFAFSDEERRVVRNYVQGYAETDGKRGKQLPPGLAKKVARGGKLPPGWQRKCVVGEIMPPEVYDQCHPLPPEVVVKMPPSPEPTLTVTIGGKAVRLLKATREILDVFDVNLPF